MWFETSLFPRLVAKYAPDTYLLSRALLEGSIIILYTTVKNRRTVDQQAIHFLPSCFGSSVGMVLAWFARVGQGMVDELNREEPMVLFILLPFGCSARELWIPVVGEGFGKEVGRVTGRDAKGMTRLSGKMRCYLVGQERTCAL